MSTFTSRARFLAGGVLTGLVCVALTVGATAQQKASSPDFSSNQVGWLTFRGEFMAVSSGPSPLRNDPAHPVVANNTGAQPTYRIADLGNPNLKPWVVERMRKDNAEVLAGKIAFTPRSSCMPAGVPGLHDIRLPAAVLRPNAQGGLDDLFGRSADPARLSRRAPFGESEAILVRRVGRPLRRRHAGGRHHRAERQDLRRQLPHARIPRSCTSWSAGS